MSLSARLHSKLVRWRVRVEDVVAVSDRLVCVVAAQPDGVALVAGDTVAACVVEGGFGPTGTWRRYTVSSADRGRFEFIAYRTLAGPASAWLDQLVHGSALVGRGPESPVRLVASGLGAIGVFGDETAVGTVRSIASVASCPVVASLSLSDAAWREPIADLVAPASIGVHERGPIGRPLEALVDDHGREHVGVVAIGMRSSVDAVRLHARDLAIPRAHVTIRPYWTPGRSGLE